MSEVSILPRSGRVAQRSAVAAGGATRTAGWIAQVKRLADELAGRMAGETGAAVEHLVVSDAWRGAGAALQAARVLPRGLSSQHRDHLAWLRFMSDPRNVATYVAALKRSSRIFNAVAADVWPRPIVTHYRPTSSLFRMRPVGDGVRVVLPTPLIGAGDSDLEILARAIFRRRDRRRNAALHAMLVSDWYRRIQGTLRSLAGHAEEWRGAVHSLDESFDRVNRGYFAGTMPRPRLVWNRAPSRHKFGHYQYSTDTVVISCVLDHPAVPQFVVDHVMHHELLHKKHGLSWRNGRGHAHTDAFRREERRFERYHEADAFLRRLAKPRGGGVRIAGSVPAVRHS